jgi:hypothetical protein
MRSLFASGAFQGTSPRDAYLVKCDRETTTQNERDQGVSNIVMGFAPLKPAEFVVIKIPHLAGQIEIDPRGSFAGGQGCGLESHASRSI